MKREYSLQLKPAQIEDALLLFEWRNDEIMRRAAKNSHIISWEEHCSWIKRRLSLHNPDIWVALYQGCPVGMVRRDVSSEVAELSWNVAPLFRGQGFGKEMVATVCALTQGRVAAWIKTWNQASIQIARYCGMKKERTEGELEYWMREQPRSVVNISN